MYFLPPKMGNSTPYYSHESELQRQINNQEADSVLKQLPLCESLSYLEWILAGRDQTGRAELSRGGRVMFGVKSNVEEASRNSKGRPKPLSELFQCLFSFPPVDSIPVHPTPALN